MFKKNSARLYIYLLILSLLMIGFVFMSGKNQITKERVFDCGLPVIFIETDGEKRIKSKEQYVDADFFIYENYNSYENSKGSKAVSCKTKRRKQHTRNASCAEMDNPSFYD